MVRFVVYDKPTPKQRPRFSKKTGTVYTPPKTVNAEHMIRLSFLEQFKSSKIPLFEKHEPLKLIVVCYLPKPKSVKRKFPTVKPDYDNLLKTITDALQGYAFTDDAQICEVVFKKAYDAVPRTEVIIEKVVE